MEFLKNTQRQIALVGVVVSVILLSAYAVAAEPKVEISSGDVPSRYNDGAAWEQVLERPASQLNLKNQHTTSENQRMIMDKAQVKPKKIIDGTQKNNSSARELINDEQSSGFAQEPVEQYLDVASPPGSISKIVDIYLENKSDPQWFLTGFTSKSADIDLKLKQHQPSNIPLESKFQIANYGSYIRLGHEVSGRLIGYSRNYFGFSRVHLEKDYYQSNDFWTRFKVAFSGKKDWYLIRSYSEPKKCLGMGWRDTLRLKKCNINDASQNWRFLREKTDAYWIPNSELLELDII